MKHDHTRADRRYIDAFLELEADPLPEGHREAGWARLDAAIRESEPLPAPVMGEEDRRPHRRRRRIVARLVLVAAAVVGVVWLGGHELLGLGWVRSVLPVGFDGADGSGGAVHEQAPHVGRSAREEGRTRPREDLPRRRGMRGGPPTPDAPVLEAEVLEGEIIESGSDVAALVPEPRARRRTARPRREPEVAAQPEAAIADLDPEEVRLVRRAKRASQQGRDDEALELFDEHRRVYPSGILATEVRAERLILRCRMKKASRSEVRAFVEAGPAAHLQARVEASCNETTKTGTGQTDSSHPEH